MTMQKKQFSVVKDGPDYLVAEVARFTNKMVQVPLDFQFEFDTFEEAENQCRNLYFEQENGHFIVTDFATPDHQKEYEILKTKNWIDFFNEGN